MPAWIRRQLGRGILGAAVVLAAGCEALGLSAPHDPNQELSYPGGCAAFKLSPFRCSAIVETLAERAGVTPAQATSIGLLGDPGCDTDHGHVDVCARTMSFIVRARFHLLDGRALEESQFCGVGGQYSILCSDDPEVQIVTPTGGYYDVPCAGEPPDGCATRFPGPDPQAAAVERPIDVAWIEIPLDRVGRYEVDLGEGSLANGLLEEATMTLDRAGAPGYLLDAGGIRLSIASLEPDGRPFDNYYLHGRREGVERIAARIELDVLRFDPGASITLRDIVVR